MPGRARITSSVVPNEVLFLDSPIVIESRESLDPASAQGAIVVQGLRGMVRLSNKGRVARWAPEAELQPGHHTLHIRGLMTEKRKAIDDTMVIPFFVTDSRARVPKNLRVENMVRLRVGELGTERVSPSQRPSGRFIELMKASHRESGVPVELAFDYQGQPTTAEATFKRVQQNRVRKFGKLHETLYRRLANGGSARRMQVAIWLQTPEVFDPREKKIKGVTPRPTKQAVARRKASAARLDEFLRMVGSRHRAHDWRRDALAPVVYATLSAADIREIAKRCDVAAVFLYEPKGIKDLSASIKIANSDDVHALGFRGSGVKVAVWEDTPDVMTNLSITDSYKTSGAGTSDHARLTHGLIKNTESGKPHGHAPSCSLYSANSMDLDGLLWATRGKGCTVVSQSFHRPVQAGSADLTFDDIYKDWLVLQWPFPTICQATGNYWEGDSDNIQPPSDEYVNHKGYNGLTVGNHDDSADAMAGDSVFRNPTSDHGDRELPEIAANGTAVTAVGLTESGTSFAAPAVAGCAALVQNVDSTLKSWPEGCRAILLAGAKRNVTKSTWWQDVIASVDAADGTGAIDALEGVSIAKQRRSRNASATQRGWDVGTLRSNDIGNGRRTTFSYSVKVPVINPSRHVKVALAWDSKINSFSVFGTELIFGSALAVDLDLQVFDSAGTLVGYSGSWDNSYEIAEFNGVAGETYTIKIQRWSGTDDVWYGIAWTVS